MAESGKYYNIQEGEALPTATATPVPMVSVIAPSALPEGYVLDAVGVNGQSVQVTVVSTSVNECMLFVSLVVGLAPHGFLFHYTPLANNLLQHSLREVSRRDSNSWLPLLVVELWISTIFLVDSGVMDSLIALARDPAIPVYVSLVGAPRVSICSIVVVDVNVL